MLSINTKQQIIDIPLKDFLRLLGGKIDRIFLGNNYVMESFNIKIKGEEPIPSESLVHIYYFPSDPARLFDSVDRNKLIDLLTLPIQELTKSLKIKNGAYFIAYRGLREDNKAERVELVIY